MQFIFPITIIVIYLGSIWLLLKISLRKRNSYAPFSEKFLKPAGYSLSKQVDKLCDDIMEYAVGMAMIPLVIIYFWHASSHVVSSVANLILLGMGIGTLVTFLGLAKKYFNTIKKLRNLKLGLDGEQYTGQELTQLMRYGAHVYHDLRFKYGNIDHVVVARGGVFVVETKAVRKPRVNGEDGHKAEHKAKFDGTKIEFPHRTESHAIEQVILQTKLLSEFLQKRCAFDKGIPVRSVISVPGWYIQQSKKSEIVVMPPTGGNFLRPLIKHENLTEKEVAAISSVLDEFARTIEPGSKRSNPNASQFFNKNSDPLFDDPMIP